MDRFVVVTPVYEDAEAASRLFHELATEYKGAVHVIAVDDGSIHSPLDATTIADTGLSGVVIKLRRNVGHQRAIAIGVSYVAEHLPGRTIVVMDSDGEDTPKTIRELMHALESEAVHVAVAQRKSRAETLRFRLFYIFYKWLFNALTGRRIDFGNFVAMRPSAVQRLAAMQELWIHFAASVLISRLPMRNVPLDRGRRYAGQSRMNFVGLALHGLKGLMVFAEDVLVRVCIACAFLAAASVIAAIAAITLKLIGIATPGWFSVALGILVLMFLQTGALTLMTLMLTGVVRGGRIVEANYDAYILDVATVGRCAWPNDRRDAT